MPTYGPPPRRIVTSSTSIPANISDESSWEPAVIIIEEDIPRVSLLEDQAAKYPVHTHMRVPVDASDPWNAAGIRSESVPHQGVNVQFLDLAPGAKVPLHRTESVDYMIFLSGEVILGVPDKGFDPTKGSPKSIRKFTCRPGDIVVQRGTLHSWENPSQTEWARYVGIGVRSNPLEVDVGRRTEGRDERTKRQLLPAWYEEK